MFPRLKREHAAGKPRLGHACECGLALSVCQIGTLEAQMSCFLAATGRTPSPARASIAYKKVPMNLEIETGRPACHAAPKASRGVQPQVAYRGDMRKGRRCPISRLGQQMPISMSDAIGTRPLVSWRSLAALQPGRVSAYMSATGAAAVGPVRLHGTNTYMQARSSGPVHMRVRVIVSVYEDIRRREESPRRRSQAGATQHGRKGDLFVIDCPKSLDRQLVA